MLTSDELRFFSIVSRQTSLAAAARKLDVTPSAVTQRLQSIESKLGLRLTHRTGRSLQLTDEGALLAERGGVILDELTKLSDMMVVRRGEVSGTLRVMAPMGFGRQYIAPLCASFRERHQSVIVDLQLSDRLGRHPHQPWDVAIHIGALPTSTLKVRKLAANRRLLCAAPSYFSRRARPQSPMELSQHHCLALRENDEDVTLWKFTRSGKTFVVRINPAMASNDGQIVRDWAVQGQGIMIRSEWDVAENLASGALEHVLPDYQLPDANVVFLTDSSSTRNARTTKFLEHLLSQMRAPPWRRSR